MPDLFFHREVSKAIVDGSDSEESDNKSDKESNEPYDIDKYMHGGEDGSDKEDGDEDDWGEVDNDEEEDKGTVEA